MCLAYLKASRLVKVKMADKPYIKREKQRKIEVDYYTKEDTKVQMQRWLHHHNRNLEARFKEIQKDKAYKQQLLSGFQHEKRPDKRIASLINMTRVNDSVNNREGSGNKAGNNALMTTKAIEKILQNNEAKTRYGK